MADSLKVLISAYACEPDKGSEPEVGWQWALQMARFHDVTVLTRTNNRQGVEHALESLRGRHPVPQFVYHDLSPFLMKLKRLSRSIKLYYVLWQKSARKLIQSLHERQHYDLMHHVTFAGFRYPSAIWGHGVPSIWGPVGGAESVPVQLLPWRHPVSFAHEALRNLNNVLQTASRHVLPSRARAMTVILASTPEMQRAFAKFGFAAELMPTIGLRTQELPYRPRRVSEGPLKLLFVGNIITLKGVDLALDALKASATDATFTLVGSGNYLPAVKKLAQNLGLGNRVNFRGRLPREEVLRMYSQHDVFVFPSLHDTGGYAVIEAMFNELTVICLDCGGPAVAVRAGCGIKVPLDSRPILITNLAAAIRHYDRDRSAVLADGKNARDIVLNFYDWDKKGEQMNECYLAAVSNHKSRESSKSTQQSSGMSAGIANSLHRSFSVRGLPLIDHAV